ncbi:hypothetical protein KBD71_00725 [Candidatus Woesebacteria bacterium]|nr:hypothetical protein [Candidatus Woesebacteria bacterium]
MKKSTETQTLYEIVFKRNEKPDTLSDVLFYTAQLAQTRISAAYHNDHSPIIFDSADVQAIKVELLPGEKTKLMEQNGWIAKSDIDALRRDTGIRK